MNDLQIRALPVAHLEWLFNPPGLPVPERIPGTPPTTSALVRGAAGTGKTTLALGLAIGLSDALGGTVYYLSTEIAPVDVRFKLGHLGLAASAVAPLATPTPEARILTEHLVLVSDADLELPGARTAAALTRAEEVVLGSRLPGLRVVVIDAFSLVGESGSNPAMRGRLAALVQAFDALGVSVVLVEEAPVTGADWASFVVDLVFEVHWGEDPDTRARIRQLSVPKSRFATAAYGPHDYGLDVGKLAVWPDLGAVDLEELRGAIRRGPPPVVLGPSFSLIHGLVGANYGIRPHSTILVRASPWLDHIYVSLSGVTRVGSTAVVPHSEGPASVIWALIRQLRDARGPVAVLVQDAEFVLSRVRFAVPFFGALQVLSHLGPMVVIHASEEELRRVPAAFTYAEHPRTFARTLQTQRLGGLLGTYGDPFARMDAFRTKCKKDVMPPSLELRWWALLHAYLLRQRAPLDWFLAQPDPPDVEQEPYLRHALARTGQTEAATARLVGIAPREREVLEAELHLSLFTSKGLATAEPIYEERLADPFLPSEDAALMRAQLAEVRAAL